MRYKTISKPIDGRNNINKVSYRSDSDEAFLLLFLFTAIRARPYLQTESVHGIVCFTFIITWTEHWPEPFNGISNSRYHVRRRREFYWNRPTAGNDWMFSMNTNASKSLEITERQTHRTFALASRCVAQRQQCLLLLFRVNWTELLLRATISQLKNDININHSSYSSPASSPSSICWFCWSHHDSSPSPDSLIAAYAKSRTKLFRAIWVDQIC